LMPSSINQPTVRAPLRKAGRFWQHFFICLLLERKNHY
jgi:hypothetical protein